MQKSSKSAIKYYKLLLPVKIPTQFGDFAIYKSSELYTIGDFVLAIWGSKKTIAIVVEQCDEQDVDFNFDKLQNIEALHQTVFATEHFKQWLALLCWCWTYYHYNPGLMLKLAVPKRMLQNNKPVVVTPHGERQVLAQKPLDLTSEQLSAFKAIQKSTVHLLFGVTGSGKTEVYLQHAQTILERGEQVLLLVPEIGLIQQMYSQLEQRFAIPVLISTSLETDLSRAKVWQQCRLKQPLIVIGTRSAVFLPFSQLGSIIIDEEHDVSYQNQNGASYHARDVAIYRAKLCGATVVLGSATPSLESFYRQRRGKLEISKLQQRISTIKPAEWKLIKTDPSQQAKISPTLLQKLERVLAQRQQALVFINRRGYSKCIKCFKCEYIPGCTHCSVKVHLHKYPRQFLMCHQCNSRFDMPKKCAHCGLNTSWITVGSGTEKIETYLQAHFSVPVVRIDSDVLYSKKRYREVFTLIQSGQPCIIVGTQVMAKGHHFPHLALVALVDIDQQLFFQDSYSFERLAQLLIQVAGRAGRDQVAGQIYLQTSMPNDAFLQLILQRDYEKIVRVLLTMRAKLQLSPFRNLAIICFAHRNSRTAEQILQGVLKAVSADGLVLIGPVSSAVERRKGLYQFQLVVKSEKRSNLHGYIAAVQRYIAKLDGINISQFRFVIDPIDLLV